MQDARGVYVRRMSFEEEGWKAYILICHSEKEGSCTDISRKSASLRKCTGKS